MGKPLFKSIKQIAVDAQALKLAMQRGDRVSGDKSTVRYEDDDSAYINTVLPDVVVTPKYDSYDDYNKTIAARDRRALEQQQHEMNNYVRAGMNKAGEVVAGAMMMLPPVAAADPIAAGVGRVLRFAAPKLRAAARASQVATNNVSSTTPEVIHFYHGSPVRFDAFNADFIGSGEGGSKVMRGINLWPEEKIANAPKLANINSPDAPLHLGVPSKPLGGELNPTVYDVSGRGLNLYTAAPREVKGLNQSDLISQGYDGIRTPSQVTVFPESIGKLSIDKQSTIEEFVRAHPEVEKWTPWTTDVKKMQDVISASRAPEWTPEQWTAAQDAAIANGDMTEAQRLRDWHFALRSPNNIVINEDGMPLRLYHNTKERFNSFDISRIAHGKTEGNGVYSGINPQPKYGENQMDLYAYISNPYTETKEWSIASSLGGTTPSKYWNTGKNIENYIRDAVPIRNYSEYRRYLSGPDEFSSNPLKRFINLPEKIKSLLRVGDYSPNSYKKYVDHIVETNSQIDEYNDRLRRVANSDGVIVNWTGHPVNPREFVASPNRYKSADAVTYDDNGVRIPLGERDNFNMNDIRYALPFVLPSSRLSVEDEADDTQLNN